MNASSFSILDTEELTTIYMLEEGFPQYIETPSTPQLTASPNEPYLSVTHQPANTATVQRGAAVAQPAWMWDPQRRIFVCFLHHCLQGFEWCQEHTANANGSSHHCVALSAFYREANSLAVRMPVTQESEDPQIVWTAVNILFSSVLLSSIHREEFIGHLLCTRHCFSHKCLLHWRLVSYFIYCTK